MEQSKVKYGFWFWSHKLEGVLTMLAQFCKYEFSEGEIDAIKEELVPTNNELNVWTQWTFAGRTDSISFLLAYDAEEGHDMVVISITAPAHLEEKLKSLDMFQSSFKRLDPE